MKIEVNKGDITAIDADAIVNAANSSLLGGGGVDGAIHKKGGNVILEACKTISKQGGCKTGEAVITTGGNLPAKYVIHTVGPVWHGGNDLEAELLKNCYVNSLKLADKNQFTSIAFPNISTGVYGFPKNLAVEIVAEAVAEFFDASPATSIRVINFVCFDDENYQLYISKFSSGGYS